MEKKDKIDYDTHHLLWPRHIWRCGHMKELRNFWYLNVEVPKNSLHGLIHSQMSGIFPASQESAQSVLNALRLIESYGSLNKEDPIQKRLSLLIALFDSIENATAADLAEQLEIVQTYYKDPIF